MAMRMSNIRMKTVVEKEKLLRTLEENLGLHLQILEEAQAGYLTQTAKVLQSYLDSVKNGNLSSVNISLQPPVDYSEVYRNSIEMLRWNTEEKIELEADEFRQLVRDEWDWTDSFLASNRLYSETARKMSKN